ncbi:hypothetical protein Tco_1348013, partial [Tanacetum coccineum]
IKSSNIRKKGSEVRWLWWWRGGDDDGVGSVVGVRSGEDDDGVGWRCGDGACGGEEAAKVGQPLRLMKMVVVPR